MRKNKILIIGSILIIIIIAGILIFKHQKEKIVINTDKLIKVNATNELINNQYELETKYLNDFKNNNYTLDNPKIIVNPYEISPLTALVMFKTDNKVSITVTIKGKDESVDITKKFEENKEHIIPIYGLYDNYNNTITINTSDNKEKTLNIKTLETSYNKEESNIPKLNVITSDKSKIQEGLYFFSSPLSMDTKAYDINGDLRWYLTKSYFKEFKRLQNGNILISNDIIDEDFASTGMVEIDLFGKIYNYYNIETGYHNDFYEKEDGNIIIASNNPNNKTLNDYIIEIDKKTGKNIKYVDVYDILSKIDKEFMESLGRSWGYNNSVFYYAETDELILSYRHISTVISIDYSDKKLNWLLTDPKNWSSKFSKYILKPTTDNFTYPMAQHSAKLQDKNTLTLFDNGFDYVNSDFTCKSIQNSKSSAVNYTIDRDKKTITEIWSFGKDRNLFSYALGDYDIDNNNKLILFGREFVDINYDDPDCTVDNYMNLRSYLFELYNNEVVFEAYQNNGLYRVTKLTLYNNKNNYQLGKGKILNNYNETKGTNINSDYLEKIKNANETIDYIVTYNGAYISLNAGFRDEEIIKVIFVNKYGKGNIYSYKEKNNSKIMNIIPQNGEYAIYVEINGKLYKTNYKI